MANVEDRIVSISFDNAKFEAGVAKTMVTLSKLDISLKNIGNTSGLGNLSKAANGVDFAGLTKAIDQLNARIASLGKDTTGFSNIENASSKIQFTSLSSVIDGIRTKFTSFTSTFSSGIDSIKSRLTFPGAERAFDAISNAAGRLNFRNVSKQAEDVNSKLSDVGANKAFTTLESSSNKVTFDGISKGISGLLAQFNTLQVAGTAAIATLASKVTSSAIGMVKSLTLDPLTGGLQEYSTNLNSIQTILANTQASGAGLKDVNAALTELNHYSDKTIYNFSEMARNIGTFTAAGVDLKTSTQSIKGIANLAALSGSNSQQAATAMYQLSQAIASGKVGLQDWNSVVNAGMGGTVFQRALATTAQKMGTLKEESVSLSGKMKNVKIEGQSFRESIQAKPGEKSWLTSDVLTSTLKQFTGDLSDAQLKAMGFNAEQIKSIQATAKTAQNAATQVKTLGQVFDVAKETVGSGWSATFQNIFGDFEQSKKTFTELSNTINGFINTNANARNKVLTDWKALGGRTMLIAGIKDVFKGIISVIKPIKDAFRDIFPAKTGKDLYDLTVRFREFARELKIGPETADNLKRTFRGFFAVLSIGKSIIGEIFGVFKQLFGTVSGASGGILGFTGNIGDLLVELDQAIKKGDGLHKFFKGLGSVLQIPIKLIGALGAAIGGLFDGGKTTDGISKVTGELKPLGGVADKASVAFKKLSDFAGTLGDKLGNVGDKVAEAFKGFGDAVAQALGNADYGNVFAVIQTTLIGGIFLTIKKALGGGVLDLGVEGLTDKIKEPLDALTGSLKIMQASIKADILLKIASAVTILAAGIVALSLIDPKKLAPALSALTVALGNLIGGLALLTRVGGGLVSTATIPILAGSLILLAGSIDLLVIAVYAFSKLNWEELGRGLAGVAGSLTAISLGLRYMPTGIGATALALIPLAGALILLAGAMKIFATLKWEEMAKGLAAIGASLAIIGKTTATMGPSMILTGAGLVVVAEALIVMAGALKLFGSMDLESMGKGLLGIGGSLLVISKGVALMPPGLAAQAAGLVLVAAALNGIALAVRAFGSADLITLGKGIGAMGASLVTLAYGLTFMIGALPGAAALVVAAAGLNLLVPPLYALGKMSFVTIFKGLAAIAASMITLGVAGIAAAPGLGAVAIGMLAVGAAVGLIGGGIYLFVKAINQMKASSVAAAAAIVTSFTALAIGIPKAIISFTLGLVKIVEQIAAVAPKVVVAMVKIINSVLDVVIQSSPKLAEAVIALLVAVIKVIDDQGDDFLKAGFTLLNRILQGIAQNIGKVTAAVFTIVSRFIAAVGSNAPKLIASGATALAKFLYGIATNLGKIIASATAVVVKFISGITASIPKVVPAAIAMVARFISSIATKAGSLIAAGADLIVAIIKGITKKVDDVVAAGTKLAKKFLLAVTQGLVDMVDAGAKAVIRFINGVAKAIDNNSSALGKAGGNLGRALVEGMIKGMASLVPELLSSVTGIAGKVVGGFKKKLHINSPSKDMIPIGEGITEGFAKGMNDDAPRVFFAANNVADKALKAFSTVPGAIQNLGQATTGAFADSLRKGTKDDIDPAFDDLNTKLSDAITIAREKLKKAQADLDHEEAQKGKKRSQADINEATAAVVKNTEILNAQIEARKLLTQDLTTNKAQLKVLADNYQVVTDKLKEAQNELETAKKAQEDFAKSTAETYADLPDINGDEDKKAEQLSTYLEDLKARGEAVQTYAATLQRLRELGLDDATYAKLVKDGVKDQDFANQIINGGPAVIAELNAQDKKLQEVAKQLGANASQKLYQAGVDAAQGLVNGLISEQKNALAAINALADAMVAAIKKKLRIKSPSRVFAEMGKFTGEGLVVGLKDTSKSVAAAASELGDTAISSIQDTMSRVADAVSTNIEMDPTITPILDLSNVEANAKKLGEMTNVVPITAAASFGQATTISAEQTAALEAAAEAAQATSGPSLVYNQTNNSPEALTPTEIYRQTKNGLSQAKSILDKKAS